MGLIVVMVFVGYRLEVLILVIVLWVICFCLGVSGKIVDW